MKENLLLLKDSLEPQRTKLLLHDFSIKNVYVEKLDGIVNKYNKTCHSAIKMKPVDVKSSTYIDFDKGNNDKDPKFKVGIIM